MANAKILVADENPGLLTLLKGCLQTAGYQVTLTGGGEEALARAQEELYDLAIVDLKMAGMDGMTLMQRLLHRYPTLPVIILTAYGTIPSAVEATKHGAYDYLTKPFDPQELLYRIEQALKRRRLKGENAQLRPLVQDRYHCDNIVAASDTMHRVLHQVHQIAATDATVALYGESGTGKELIAKAMHAASRRAQGPFIALNCGAIPEGLLENELFGHVKGAYTGANQATKGLLQQADGGTLFLDEIAELSPALQVKLLRVLQEYEFAPLGAERSVQVDFRLIAATNQDLWNAVGERRFREDLYYRVHVIPVCLPPLRERPDDIPLLAHHYLQHFGQKLHKDVQGFSPEAMQRLMRYAWPGNVRELTNVIERAVVLATHRLITPDLLLLGSAQRQGPHRELVSFKAARDNFERAYLIHALTAAKGNISRAAALAGKHRGDVYHLLRKHGLDSGHFKEDKRSSYARTPTRLSDSIGEIFYAGRSGDPSVGTPLM